MPTTAWAKSIPNRKEFDKLRDVLETLLGINEAFTYEHRQKFNEFGISLRKNGHYDESIRYYEKSLEIVKEDENVFFNLARVYFEKGLNDKCIANLEQALELESRIRGSAKVPQILPEATSSGLIRLHHTS